MREYGLEHLADRGEEVTVRAAHAAYYLALAERTAPVLRGQVRARGWWDSSASTAICEPR